MIYYQDEWITIYQGDCREILSTLDVDTIVTDPPYGINFDVDYGRFKGLAKNTLTHKSIIGDDKPVNLSFIMNYPNVCLFGANNFTLRPGTLLVWDKRTIKGNKGVMADAEIAWLNRGHGVYIFNHTWNGFNRASERGTAYHPTQKPVAVMQWAIQRTATKQTELICDIFMGSGSTLIAARNLGYKSIGIELDEQYCEVTVNRLQNTSLPLPFKKWKQSALI